MNRTNARVRALSMLAFAAGALTFASNAWAHAHVSPGTLLAKTDNLFALTVPTEKEGVTTTTIELRPPDGFSIDAFGPSPGWKRDVETTGSGENTRITQVTWSGGAVPTDESAFFQFVGEAESSKGYAFGVRQTYSDGEVADWSGPESSNTPAPVIEAKSSLGDGGGSTLAIVALIVAATGLLLAALALATRTGARPLA
jgi:uncharacterized protein YcnI